MEKNQVIESLRKEAEENKVAQQIFQMWATRERSRASVTLESLEQGLRVQGQHFERAEYIEVLRKLSQMGLGRLEERRGRVRALRGITVKLQAIGKAAIGKEKALAPFQPRAKEAQATGARSAGKPVAIESFGITRPLSVSFVLKNRVVNLPIPEYLNEEEVAILIKRLRG